MTTTRADGPDAPECARRLVAAVDLAAPALMALEHEGRRPAPGKWSPREIVGHLIDSACNNHRRFVTMRDSDDLLADGYAQDEWVSAQRYQDAPWQELVTLWQLYNRHLARVMTFTPAHDRERSRTVHNLEKRAFHPVPSETPVSLGYFMNDYVDHLEHHLRQVLG